MRQISTIIGILILILVGIFGILWLSAYNPKEFRGAGPMRDTGYFSYYRYHAPLGQIPLSMPGTYTLKFSGLPSERMTLLLVLPSDTSLRNHNPWFGPSGDQLKSLTTELKVEISNTNGTILCSAIGTPAGIGVSSRWGLVSSNLVPALMHEQCRDILFFRKTEYNMRVTIKNVDPRSPKISMTAILEGGGHEIAP